MLRTILQSVGILLLVLGCPISLGWIEQPPSPSPPSTESLYDSIRTDLSAYAWPLIESRVMTSSFGEYRRTHFHAGIDISTGDVVGFPVTAARDGYVARISVGPTGYGKILYVRHPDGYTTTYAHLRGFIPLIDSLVRREQLQREMYPVDIRPGPDAVRVSRGEVIAYSGDTGSGSEHLHFEIRDEHNNGVNPLLCEVLNIEDTLPPLIRAVAFVPAGPQGMVNNDWDPVLLRASQSTHRTYRLERVVSLRGDVGIAVDTRDRSNRSNFLHGVYALQLSVDDSVVMRVEYSRAPIDDANQIRLVYVQHPAIVNRGRFHKLFIDGPHRLPLFGAYRVGDGVLHADSFQPGRHAFTIDIADYNGNSSTLTGTFAVSARPSGDEADNTTHSRSPAAIPEMTVDYPDEYVRVLIDGLPSLSASPEVVLQEGDEVRPLPVRRIGQGRYAGAIIPNTPAGGRRTVIARVGTGKSVHMLSHEISLVPIVPGIAGDFLLDGGNLRIVHGPSALYRRINLRFSADDEGSLSGYRLEPHGIPLDKGITIGIKKPSGLSSAGLYLRSGSNWTLLSPDSGTDREWIWGTIRQFVGDVSILADSLPPDISGIVVRPTGASKPSISFRFRDNLSGVEYKSVKLYINETMVIPEIDGEHRRATYQPEVPLSRGPHRLTIQCTDKMGNRVAVGRTFRVR